MSDEFRQFITNTLKAGKDRRVKEAPARLVRLQELWTAVPEEERTEDLEALSKRGFQFLVDIITEDTKDQSGSEMTTSLSDFDLRTAGQVVTEFNGTSTELNDFLDCSRWYHDSIKLADRPKFLEYLLKVKLKGKAKTALVEAPKSFEALEKLLKERFKPRATIGSLQNSLSALQQRAKDVSTFAADIEELVQRMTDLQVAEKGEDNREIIRSLNDTLALNVLKMGSNAHVKKVLLAGQVKTFTQGVSLALEAESSLPTEGQQAQVNFVRRGGYTGRGRGRKQNNRGSKTSDGSTRQRGGRNFHRGHHQSRSRSGNDKGPSAKAKQEAQVSVAAVEEQSATIYS